MKFSKKALLLLPLPLIALIVLLIGFYSNSFYLFFTGALLSILSCIVFAIFIIVILIKRKGFNKK